MMTLNASSAQCCTTHESKTEGCSSHCQQVIIGDHQLHLQHLQPEQLRAGEPLTLVFLHEGLGSIEMWKQFPAQLCRATGCEGIVYDRYGYGFSTPVTLPRPLDYLEQEGLQRVPALLEALDLNNVVLIGHSDGGTIALLAATVATSRIKAVITEAAHVFVEDVTLSGIEEAVQAYATTALPEKLARYHGEHTDHVFHAWCDTWLHPDFKAWNIESYLREIHCPLLVMQGVQDEYGSVLQVNSIAEKSSGAAQIAMIDHCGHVPHHQALDAVFERMQAFIDAL